MNYEQARELIRKATIEQWNTSKESLMKAILKGLIKRPTSWEKIIIDLCEKYNLPFRYVGNGQVIINYGNPDFICTNGQKKIRFPRRFSASRSQHHQLRSLPFSSGRNQ